VKKCVSWCLSIIELKNARRNIEIYTMFFIIISAPHVLGGFSAHHQELIKLYVQPWVLPCFPAVYRWCGWVRTVHSSNLSTPAVDSRKAVQ